MRINLSRRSRKISRENLRLNRLTSEAVEWLEDSSDEIPFFLYFAPVAIHFPYTPPGLDDEFEKVTVDRNDFSATMQHKFDECLRIGGKLDESMQQYIGDVYQIDLNVGRVLQVIDELGLREDTIVVFSSDHGPAPVILANKGARKYSKNMLGYAGEFRGGKHELYEGGTRVPFIIRWPGHVQAGRVDNRNVCSFIDWLPTLCAITGVEEIPEQLDGEDISDIWFGADRPRSKPLFWKVSAAGGNPVMRDGRWKFHLNHRRGEASELYDLASDPRESVNVAAQHPDMVATLSEKLRSWEDELPNQYEKKRKKADKK